MRRLWPASLCLILTACSGLTTPTVPLGHDFTLSPGETARIDDTTFDIRFVGVEGDSRCPADAFCIQGGDALVKIEIIDRRAGTQSHDLHTGDLRPVKHGDLTITLVKLVPYPFSSRTIPPGDYRATLIVSR